VLPGILRKPTQLHCEIKETPPGHVARAADHQRGDHRSARGDILAHGLLECCGGALDRAGRRSFQMPPRGRELLAPELQHACHPSGIGQAGGLLELGKRRPIVARVQRLKPVDEIVSHAVV